MSADTVEIEGRAFNPPALRNASVDDYENIRRLVLRHEFQLPSFEEWHSLWFDNPLRSRCGDGMPLGWVLETSAGEIVGTMGTTWALYHYGGEELISASGRFWFVAPPYRGFALRLMSEYFSQPQVDLFINNTVAPAAIGSFEQLSDRVPIGDWQSASFWVTLPLDQVRTHPACASLQLSDFVSDKPLPKPSLSYSIEAVDRFDSRFDAFWHELVRQNPQKLLADRSNLALSWHFAIPMRNRRLWILTASRNGQLRAYCTLTQQDYAFQLPALPLADARSFRGMRLVDFQSIEPETDLLSDLLAAVLQRCCAEDMLILENLGSGVPKMRIVDEYAPYRAQLTNWKFFFSAVDPELHARLHQPEPWDPSAYDGDASFE